jgi:hypothetical protein
VSDADRERFDEPEEMAQFGRRAPPKAYTEIDTELTEDLGQQHTYGETAAKEHAKEALENLYASEFPIEDPPESWERYEAELAVRHLRQSITDMLASAVERDYSIFVDDADDPEVIEEVAADGVGSTLAKTIIDARVEQAKNRIDVMATYGQLAEPHIAALTYSDIHSDVRAYATETLAEIRDRQEPSKSLSETIRDWLRGDG